MSGLYNKKGKAHDLGADFGLTSDVYTKPNPFYTKNLTKNKSVDNKLEPVYHPVYNPSVTQDSNDDTVYGSKNNNPSSSYGAPSSSYGEPTGLDHGYSVQTVPSASYGVQPSSSYYYQPSQAQQYPSYGAPTYYPSSPVSSPVVTHHSSEVQKSHSEWFLTKLMKKFDLILMSKILLKLIIFKKIVKFIGIICLLLFIPVLKKKFEEHTDDGEEEEERRIQELDAYGKRDPF